MGAGIENWATNGSQPVAAICLGLIYTTLLGDECYAFPLYTRGMVYDLMSKRGERTRLCEAGVTQVQC